MFARHSFYAALVYCVSFQVVPQKGVAPAANLTRELKMEVSSFGSTSNDQYFY